MSQLGFKSGSPVPRFMLWNTNLFSKEKVCKREEEQEDDILLSQDWIIFHCVMYHTLWVHSPTDGHLSCLLILSIVNSAAITMECKYVVEILFSLILGTYTEVDLLDSMIHIFLVFWGNSILFFHSDWASLYSHQQCISIPFSPHAHHHLLSHPDGSHSNRYKWICFPWWLEMSLMCLLTIWITPLEKCSSALFKLGCLNLHVMSQIYSIFLIEWQEESEKRKQQINKTPRGKVWQNK